LETAGAKSPAGRKIKQGHRPKNQTASGGHPHRGILGANNEMGRNVLAETRKLKK
jgi:hypothetical protein